MSDCRDLQCAFFVDPFRSPRLVDRLEEDLIHHASVLSECNSRNVTLKADTPPGSVLMLKFTTSNVITGAHSELFYGFFLDWGTTVDSDKCRLLLDFDDLG